MRVLIQSRTNFYTMPGGDTIQLTKTKEQLEKLGIEVDINLELEPDLSGYDIVHLSNVTRIQETYLQMKNAKKQGKSVVLSTIFWPMDEFEKNGQIGIRKIIGSALSINSEEKLKAFARFIKDKDSRNIATKNLWRIGYKQMQDYVVKNADYFLPNSEMEMEEFAKYFGIANEKYSVIPNGIDKDVAEQQLSMPLPEEFLKYKDAIICVGRIETRKNQLALLKALEKTNYKVILVGKPSSNQQRYYNKVKKFVDLNDQFIYIERMSNEQLYALYRVCKVSALPSWLDTPGLVSLEAGAMGCNLVVSTKGSTAEYFSDYAEYCLPDDLEGIRHAVDTAYEKSQNDKLKNRIFENYTWEIAATKTLDAYREVLRI